MTLGHMFPNKEYLSKRSLQRMGTSRLTMATAVPVLEHHDVKKTNARLGEVAIVHGFSNSPGKTD